MGLGVPWVYPWIMVASVLTAVALRSRTPQPSGLTGGQRLRIALGAFCGAMIGAKLPFAVSDLAGPARPAGSGSRTARRSSSASSAGYVGGRAGQGLSSASASRPATASPSRWPAAVGRRPPEPASSAGCCHGDPDRPPLGRRLRRRHPPPPRPALRAGLPLHDGRPARPGQFAAPRLVPPPALQALHHAHLSRPTASRLGIHPP